MKVKDIIKKQTLIIAVAVVLVAVSLIGVSYSIFFDVKKNANNQIITAGNLKFTISNIAALTINEPVSESEGLQSPAASYTVKNKDSNLPAAYTIYIYAGANNTIDLSALRLSLDGDTTSGSTVKKFSELETTTGTDTAVNGKTLYVIDSNTIAANTDDTNAKLIRVWADENSIEDDVSKVVDLELFIVSEVDERE